MSESDSTEQCRNVFCEKEATREVVLIGVSPDPQPHCDEHYRALKEIEEQKQDTGTEQ